MNRNDKGVDPVFLSTAFRLKKDSISLPVKSKYGFHIIQMIERNGDDATVKHILRFVPITDQELAQSRHKLDTVRSKIISGKLDFNEAALKYSDDESVKFSSPFFKSQDGSTYVTIDQLDKDVVAQISKMKPGDISAPMNFEDERKKKGVKVIYFKSRTEPHRMNIKDDYSRISQMALEQKKSKVLDKWFKEKLPTNHIEIDEANRTSCTNLEKILGKEVKGF